MPGTLCDSLTLVSVLLEQETALQPTEVTTDTAAYTDLDLGSSIYLASSSARPWLTSARSTSFALTGFDVRDKDGLACRRSASSKSTC